MDLKCLIYKNETNIEFRMKGNNRSSADKGLQNNVPYSRSLQNGPTQPKLTSLPTIQVDTVPTPPPSPTDSDENEVDPSQIDVRIEEAQKTNSLSNEEQESLRIYIEELLSTAMVVAEKKLKFVGIDDDDDDDEPEANERCQAEQEDDNEPIEDEPDEDEIRAIAEKVIEEIIEKATEEVEKRIAKELEGLDFPITFDEAPDYVKDVASDFIKDIVGRAIALAEEKAVPNVPFSFEDVDMMKTNGPWYVRVREALVRVLRNACFCTPRRNDS